MENALVIRVARGLSAMIVALAILGCSYFESWDTNSNRWIGKSSERLLSSWGSPMEARDIGDGRKEFKYHLYTLDPSCFHWWLVDERGIIYGFRYQGYCRPIG